MMLFFRRFIVAGLLFLMANPASAGPVITVDDTSPNDTVTITLSGFILNGTPVLNRAETGPPPGPPMASVLAVVGTWPDPTGSTPDGQKTIYLVEKDDPTKVSDIISIRVAHVPQGAQIDVVFQSDNDSSPGVFDPLPLGALTMVETGAFQELGFPGVSVLVASDAIEVPEPAGITLICIGSALMAGYSRRQQCARTFKT
jgi:hypothetical protein